MNTNKVHAFSLSEIVVALVVTVIVVGLAFNVLRLVQKQMWSIEKNYEQGTEVNLLKQALWVDFNTFSQFYFNERTNTLEGENPLQKVTYQFYPDFILRNRDTLPIKLVDKEFFFDGDSIVSGKIDGIRLTKENGQGNNTSVFVFKPNAASEYMR